MSAGRSAARAASAGSHTAERQKRLPPYLSALRAFGILAKHNAIDATSQDFVQFWSDAVQGIDRIGDRAVILAAIARQLNGSGLHEAAAALLANALIQTLATGRGVPFEVLGVGSPILARIDEGRQLSRILDVIIAIDTWWNPAVTAHADAPVER